MDKDSAKLELKNKIRELKGERQKALDAHDSAQLKRVRRSIHGLKRKLRGMARLAH